MITPLYHSKLAKHIEKSGFVCYNIIALLRGAQTSPLWQQGCRVSTLSNFFSNSVKNGEGLRRSLRHTPVYELTSWVLVVFQALVYKDICTSMREYKCLLLLHLFRRYF